MTEPRPLRLRLVGRRDPTTGLWVWVRQAGSLDRLAAELRRSVLEADDAGHFLREWAFEKWQNETVYPAAVDRWVAAILKGARCDE